MQICFLGREGGVTFSQRHSGRLEGNWRGSAAIPKCLEVGGSGTYFVELSSLSWKSDGLADHRERSFCVTIPQGWHSDFGFKKPLSCS